MQWLVIWLTTVLCLVAWLSSDPPWEAFVLPAALVLALFCWQLSADFVNRTKE